MIESTTTEFATRDIRTVEITQVCALGEWLTKYMRLEREAPRDAKQLLRILVTDTREFDGDFGVFGISD